MCELCLKTECPPVCPNYILPKVNHYCSYCGDGIMEGEKYIVNEDNEYRHSDCYCNIEELLGWLGYEIKIMEDCITHEKYC